MRETVAVWSNAVGFGATFSAVVVWLRRRLALGLFLSIASRLSAQTATPTFLPLAPGTLTLSFSVTNPSGRVATLSKAFAIVAPDVTSLEAFVTFQPARWFGQGSVGKPFCVFVQAKDTSGNIVTGRRWIATNSDTTLLRVNMTSTACTDTTVNSALVLSNPFPPL